MLTGISHLIITLFFFNWALRLQKLLILPSRLPDHLYAQRRIQRRRDNEERSQLLRETDRSGRVTEYLEITDVKVKTPDIKCPSW